MYKKIIMVSIAALAVTPTFTGASDIGSLVGEPCLVPVFHTQFAFPPEGGQIIRATDGQMYFVRNYLPGCADAGRGGTVVVAGSSANTFPSNNNQLATTTTYTAPRTGICY